MDVWSRVGPRKIVVTTVLSSCGVQPGRPEAALTGLKTPEGTVACSKSRLTKGAAKTVASGAQRMTAASAMDGFMVAPRWYKPELRCSPDFNCPLRQGQLGHARSGVLTMCCPIFTAAEVRREKGRE